MSQATDKLIDNFAQALKDKLNEADQKHGFKDNWLTDDWQTRCQTDLRDAVVKGDPLDVAAYAAFCWFRGWKASDPISLNVDLLQMIADGIGVHKSRVLYHLTSADGARADKKQLS